MAIIPVEKGHGAFPWCNNRLHACRKGSTSEYTVNKYGLVLCGHASRASSCISQMLDKPSVTYIRIEDHWWSIKRLEMYFSFEARNLLIFSILTWNKIIRQCNVLNCLELNFSEINYKMKCWQKINAVHREKFMFENERVRRFWSYH